MGGLNVLTSSVCSIARALSVKVWLILFGLIAGIPTSWYGLQWVGFKLAKQQADCINNIYYDIANTKGITPQQQLDEIEKVGEKHSACLNGVSSDKGTVEFLKEQSDRLQQGRP